MFVLEPLLSLLLLCLILHKQNHCLRHSVLSGALVWAVLLVAMTEVLSLFRSLTFPWVSGLWGIVILILFPIGLRLNKSVTPIGRLKVAKTSPISRLLLLRMFLIVATVGLIAWVAPPNTTDSMTYHMSRVAHWIQNQSVSHYPTNILRQLYLASGSIDPFSVCAIVSVYCEHNKEAAIEARSYNPASMAGPVKVLLKQ
jgi:hypothetical protein